MVTMSDGWLGIFKTAIAIHDYEPADQLELQLKEGEVVHIAGKRNEDWYIGCSTSNVVKLGLFPSVFVSELSSPTNATTSTTTITTDTTTTNNNGPPVPSRRTSKANIEANQETKMKPETTTTTNNTILTEEIARRELHEYYFRYHRDKIHKLPRLLASYSGHYESLYHELKKQFSTSPNDLLITDIDLEAPRQIKCEERCVELTWSTRELYECNISNSTTTLDRNGNHRYTLALKYQDVMPSNLDMAEDKSNVRKSTKNATESWNFVVCHESLKVKLDKETGLTHVWLTGLFPGCEYRCCLSMYDMHDQIEVRRRRKGFIFLWFINSFLHLYSLHLIPSFVLGSSKKQCNITF